MQVGGIRATPKGHLQLTAFELELYFIFIECMSCSPAALGMRIQWH
jgi:hypothetical protein